MWEKGNKLGRKGNLERKEVWMGRGSGKGKNWKEIGKERGLGMERGLEREGYGRT